MDSFKTDFRPQTHVEIQELKPLRAKLSDKYIYVCHIDNALNAIKLWANKDYLLGLLDTYAKMKDGGIKKTKMLSYCFKAMALLLFEIGEHPKGWLATYRYRKFFVNYMLERTSRMFDLWDKLMVHESRLFFLLKSLKNLELIQQEPFTKTAIELSLLDTISGPRRSYKSQTAESLRKNGWWQN